MDTTTLAVVSTVVFAGARYLAGRHKRYKQQTHGVKKSMATEKRRFRRIYAAYPVSGAIDTIPVLENKEQKEEPPTDQDEEEVHDQLSSADQVEAEEQSREDHHGNGTEQAENERRKEEAVGSAQGEGNLSHVGSTRRCSARTLDAPTARTSIARRTTSFKYARAYPLPGRRLRGRTQPQPECFSPQARRMSYTLPFIAPGRARRSDGVDEDCDREDRVGRWSRIRPRECEGQENDDEGCAASASSRPPPRHSSKRMRVDVEKLDVESGPACRGDEGLLDDCVVPASRKSFFFHEPSQDGSRTSSRRRDEQLVAMKARRKLRFVSPPRATVFKTALHSDMTKSANSTHKNILAGAGVDESKADDVQKRLSQLPQVPAFNASSSSMSIAAAQEEPKAEGSSSPSTQNKNSDGSPSHTSSGGGGAASIFGTPGAPTGNTNNSNTLASIFGASAPAGSAHSQEQKPAAAASSIFGASSSSSNEKQPGSIFGASGGNTGSNSVFGQPSTQAGNAGNLFTEGFSSTSVADRRRRKRR